MDSYVEFLSYWAKPWRTDKCQLTIPKEPPRLGQPRTTNLRCEKASFFALIGDKWTPIFIVAQENWQRSVGYGLGTKQFPGFWLYPAFHVAKENELPIDIESMYMGGEASYWPYASSTFKFKYNWGGNAGEYYIVRWLENGERIEERKKGKKRQEGFPILDDRDFEGFLKVVAV
jgi:hypothetical protein